MCKASNSTSQRRYRTLDIEFAKKHFMAFYLQKESFRKYCEKAGVAEQRSQLSRVAGKIYLLDMKAMNRPWFVVQELLEEYFKKRDKANIMKRKQMSEDNKVLTADEEQTVVETCRFLSVCGMGIDRNTCLDLVNEVLKARIDAKDFEPVTRGVVTRLILRNKDLLGLFSGNALDPARVRQENVDVKDAMFVRLDNYIKYLHACGKVPWKCWAEVPSDDMSNMDEVATNCQDHRKKLIGDALHLGRLFQELCGDSKMPVHITMCITTKANGK